MAEVSRIVRAVGWQVAELEVAAEGHPGSGEDGVALAGRLAGAARDKSSCLSQALEDEFASVKAVWTRTGVDKQVRADRGCSDASLATGSA